MGKVQVVPRPLAEIVHEHLQRVKPDLAHNISEERLADWQADPAIIFHLTSITCLDLSTIVLDCIWKKYLDGSDLSLAAYWEQTHLGVLLECTPGLTKLKFGRALSVFNSREIKAVFGAIGRLTKLQSLQWLRLPSDRFTDLTDARSSLPHLVELDICGTAISSEQALVGVLQHLTGLTTLKIFDDDDQILPHNMGEGIMVCKILVKMTALRSLSIKGMARGGAPVLASNVGRALHSLTQLVELHMKDDLFCVEIFGAVSTMAALQTLKINSSEGQEVSLALATSLASALCGLTQLGKLHLMRQCFCIEGATTMAHAIQQLTQLQELKMGLVWTDDGNCMSSTEAVQALTAPLYHLTGLTSLVTYEGICSPDTFRLLATAIGRMTALTCLDVGGYANGCGSVGSTALADGLQSLTFLTTLGMAGNYAGSEGATHVARALLNLTKLTDLNLEGNDLLVFHGDSRLGLEVLAPSLARMSNLTSLHMGNNTAFRNSRNSRPLENLSDVSRAIAALTEALHQKSNLQLLVLPNISFDFSSETPDAAKEVYGPLGEALLGMTSLRQLSCGIKPFALVFKDSLPDEIAQRGKEDFKILEYVRELRKQGTVPCSMLRLLVIGIGEAGKTCLQRALFNENGLTTAIALDDRTVAIDTHPSWKPAGEDLDVTVWDFAGQLGYQSAHSPFLSERCLSMLVFRADRGTSADVIFHDQVKPWLDLLHAHSPGGHVLLVCTHWESPSVGREQVTLTYQQRVREVLKKVKNLSLSRVEELNRATEQEATNIEKKLSNLERKLQGANEVLGNILHAPSWHAPSQKGGHGTRAREWGEKQGNSLEQEVQAVRERRTRLCMRNSGDAKQMQILLAKDDMNGTSADGVYLVECIRGDGSSVKSLRDAIVTSAKALPFVRQAIPAGWMQLKDEMQALSESEFQSSILVDCDALSRRLYESPKLKAWLRWRPFSDAKREIVKGIQFWQDLGFVKITSDEQYVIVHPPRLINLLRPLIQHVPFKDLVEKKKANDVVNDFYKLDSDMQAHITAKLIYGLEKNFILDAWLLSKLKFWADMKDAARTQALQILSDFNLVVDRRGGGNLLQAAGKQQYLCVCRMLCCDAAPRSVAGMHSAFSHSMKEVKITVTYKVSPICPPGLFPQFLAQQIVARHHPSETHLPIISPAGLFMQIKDLANNDQKMLIELHPIDSSIVVKCSSLGLLRDACCTLEGTVSSLFPGLSLSVKVLFPYPDGDQFVWHIYGNMVAGHSFGQILEQKRWDSNMDCIEPVTHDAQDSEENVKGILKYTPTFSALPKCKLRSILKSTLGLTASFFISHSWGDKSESSGFAKRLVGMLEEVSSELVWYDSEQLSDVNHFPSKMQQGIEHAQCIIIFLSRVYLSRQNCLLELMWAWKQFKLNGKQLIILPVDSALTLGALAEWAKDGRDLEVDGSGAGGPFTIHHSTIKFVSENLKGFKFRTEWQDDSATDEQRREAVLEIAKERPSPLEYKDRKNVKMECKTDNGTWLLADLGEEELSENFYSTGTKGAMRSSAVADDNTRGKQSRSEKDNAALSALSGDVQDRKGTKRAHGEFQDGMELLDSSLKECMTAQRIPTDIIVKLCQDLGNVGCLQDLADLLPEDLDASAFKDLAPRFKRLVQGWIKEQQQLREQSLQPVVSATPPILAIAHTDGHRK